MCSSQLLPYPNSGLWLFSLDVIYYLVIVGLCAVGQEAKGSFTAPPESNKQALFALSYLTHREIIIPNVQQ